MNSCSSNSAYGELDLSVLILSMCIVKADSIPRIPRINSIANACYFS